jgi:hypothetical protein
MAKRGGSGGGGSGGASEGGARGGEPGAEGARGGGAGEGAAKTREAPKTFTVATANATLPLVRVIVKDIMEKWRELGRLRAELADAEAHQLTERKKKHAQEEVERIEQDLKGCVRELAELGASIKDYEVGLVDFPMKQGAKTVLLCWKAGEGKIGFWHDQEGGYAGRRPIEELER